jgi:REP element-mobilizing transposase RayT
MRRLEDEAAWTAQTATVMRDHVHLLIGLGAKADLSAVMRLFKGRTSPLLRSYGLSWERGYFDHKMRTDEDLLPVFRYVFLNPYRAGLVHEGQKWPGYWCAAEDWKWFESTTDDGSAVPEWLA